MINLDKITLGKKYLIFKSVSVRDIYYDGEPFYYNPNIISWNDNLIENANRTLLDVHLTLSENSIRELENIRDRISLYNPLIPKDFTNLSFKTCLLYQRHHKICITTRLLIKQIMLDNNGIGNLIIALQDIRDEIIDRVLLLHLLESDLNKDIVNLITLFFAGL